MIKLILLVIALIGAVIAWFARQRAEEKAENEFVVWKDYMKENGAQFSVPVEELEIVSTSNREVKEHNAGHELGRAMAMSEYLGASEPKYETTILTRFKTKLNINGEEVEVFSQLYPKDKNSLQFALIGKEQVEVYMTPDGQCYFDV